MKTSASTMPTPPEPSLKQLMFEGVAPSLALADPSRVMSMAITRENELTPEIVQCAELRILSLGPKLEHLPDYLWDFPKLRTLRIAGDEVPADLLLGLPPLVEGRL